MIISEKMQNAINEQINKELYSEYLYLAMASYFYGESLDGFGNFFVKQAEEEREHAMKFFRYVVERRGNVTFEAIAKPEAKFGSVIEVFEQALKHEEFVTDSIHKLVDLAKAENDYASESFLKWYVDEQVEEEASMEGILEKLKMVKGNVNAVLMLDGKLGQR